MKLAGRVARGRHREQCLIVTLAEPTLDRWSQVWKDSLDAVICGHRRRSRVALEPDPKEGKKGMRSGFRIVTAAVGALVVVVAAASPAHALVEKRGSKSCSAPGCGPGV